MKQGKEINSAGLITLSGIRLSDGTYIQPGLFNSFENFASLPWYSRNRTTWLTPLVLLLVFLFTVVRISYDPYADDALDKLAVTMDFGDIVQPFKRQVKARVIIEIDEVFGNQYVKKDEKIDPNAVYTEDPRIAGAVNPVVGGATLPVDLTPEMIPQYTAEARAAAIEGTVTLEMIIAEDGKVLRVKPVGKPLGLGLDQAAAATYRRKKFKPSVGPNGPITVKFYQPVRFVLE